jgi:serine protease Do
MRRTYSFFTLLAVISISIVFGMVAGGFLNRPRVMYAAGSHALASGSEAVTARLSAGGSEIGVDFADIAEAASRAVVNVTNKRKPMGESDPHSKWMEWWFGRPESEDGGSPEGEALPHRFNPGMTTSGSGFLISDDGYILSNNHVVANADKLTIRLDDGSLYDAELIGTDPAIDLAVLKIDAGDRNLPYLELGDSSDLRVGEWVIAIGNPQEFDRTVTVGVVSGLDRRVALPGTDFLVAAFIQTDAAINFGNSGGPLLDKNGRVVAINTAISRGDGAEGIGFALQIDQARSAMEQLMARGEVHRGFLGVTMNPRGVDPEVQEYYNLPDRYGVLLDVVTEGGPADLAGLKKGDIIRSVDGKPIRNNNGLVGLIASRMPGETVELEIIRNGKTMIKEARLVDRGEALSSRLRTTPLEFEEDEGSLEEGRATSLGITVETYDVADARRRYGRQVSTELRGVEVTDVEFGSQAAEKGLRPGEIIITVNGKSVRDVGDWRRVMRSLNRDQPVMLEKTGPTASVSEYIFLDVE